jgi:phosphoglycolate phosphatase-like HAD superfamily hydrolase
MFDKKERNLLQKLFVWDFHGVLEKGNDDAVVAITNLALQQHGHARRLLEEESKMLSGKFWHEYFAYLLPACDAEEWHRLQNTCLLISQNQPKIIASHISLNDHAKTVLERIKEEHHEQILLSNTSPNALSMFVKIVGIESYFPPLHRFGIDAHTQAWKTKKECLETYLLGKEFPGGLVSIGDSPADVALVANYPNGIGYLYTHPGRKHRQENFPRKIHDLRAVLQEL